MVRGIPIAARETEEYALGRPDIVRVDVKRKVVLVDNIERFYATRRLEV